MNPLRETFHFLYSNKLKHKDLQPAFGALVGTTFVAYANLLVLTMLTDSFTGFFGWLRNHGVPTLIAVALSVAAIGRALFLCWVANGKLERARIRSESHSPPNATFVYANILLSILAVPVTGFFMHQLGK